MKKFFITFLILAGTLSPFAARGDMVSPDNTTYHIYADAVDAGGILSTGGIYNLEDTIGEAFATSTSGGVYQVRGGYQAMTSSSVSIAVSNSSLNLGALSNLAVNTASTAVTVNTDDESGYALSIGSVSGTSLAAVADGAVTAGSEEYGFAASGGDSILVGDWAVVANQPISASSTAANNSVTTLTFKASVGGATVSGVYTQNIVLQASANLGL